MLMAASLICCQKGKTKEDHKGKIESIGVTRFKPIPQSRSTPRRTPVMSVMSPLFAGEHFCLRGNDRNKRVTVARVPPPFTLTAGRAETPAGNAAWKVGITSNKTIVKFTGACVGSNLHKDDPTCSLMEAWFFPSQPSIENLSTNNDPPLGSNHMLKASGSPETALLRRLNLAGGGGLKRRMATMCGSRGSK